MRRPHDIKTEKKEEEKFLVKSQMKLVLGTVYGSMTRDRLRLVFFSKKNSENQKKNSKYNFVGHPIIMPLFFL